MIIMGIDPDRGWAVVKHTRNKRVLAAGSVPGVPEMADVIRGLSDQHQIDTVRIEKPSTRHVHPRAGCSKAQMLKVAVNVGENRAKAEALYWFCEGLGLSVVYCNPVRNGTKLGARQIERLTGWTGRTNEHARDALVLAWV
jgi:hypothetical protein